MKKMKLSRTSLSSQRLLGLATTPTLTPIITPSPSTTPIAASIIPFFSPVIGVSFAIIINDEVILVQSPSDDFLVAFLVNLVV